MYELTSGFLNDTYNFKTLRAVTRFLKRKLPNTGAGKNWQLIEQTEKRFVYVDDIRRNTVTVHRS